MDMIRSALVGARDAYVTPADQHSQNEDPRKDGKHFTLSPS